MSGPSLLMINGELVNSLDKKHTKNIIMVGQLDKKTSDGTLKLKN